METLEKHGVLIVVALLGGLGLYALLSKKTGAAALSTQARRYTAPNTGGTVATDTAAFTNSFATLYKLFAGGGSSGGVESTPFQGGGSPSILNTGIFTDTTGQPGGTSGGVAFGPPSPISGGSTDPLGSIGSDPGSIFDTGGSISDSSLDPSTMDVSGVTGDSGSFSAFA